MYYWVSSPDSIAKILRDAEATGVPKTNLQYLRTFPVALPPLPEQRAIASILGALDDKIELNRRMNATLEAMARAIFQSWFVDFDPVRAKAEGRETGMPAEIAALFPDGFVESELGEIPEGWGLCSIGDIAHNLRRTLRPEQIAGDTAEIGPEHMPQKSIALAEWGNAADLEATSMRLRAAKYSSAS